MRLSSGIAALALAGLAACGAPFSESETSEDTVPVASATEYAGDWATTLKVPAGPEIGLIIHISEPDGSGGYDVTLNVPQQGAKGLEGKNGRVDEDGRFQAEFPVIGASINLKREGDTLTGAFMQGLPFPVTFEPAENISPPPRPQEENLVRDYTIIEVEFPGGADGVTLAGELTMPDGAGPYPGAVLISGSGPQDRNEELMDHKPFLILSDYLTQSGYAVLRYDDRGTAESTGDFSEATTQDFADDAAAALKFLHAQPGIDPGRTGYIGHSEGGFIAPLATQTEPADFMVFLAGPSQTLPDVILRQSRDLGEAAGMPEGRIKLQTKLQEDLFAAVSTAPQDEAFEAAKEIISKSPLVPAPAVEAQARQISSPWMLWMMQHDPIPSIAAYDGPVLALFAGKDLQVAPDANAPDMRAALSHPASVVKTLPGLNHLFQPAQTGAMTEYYDIEVTFDEAAMDEVVTWMNGLGENP